tara:strand:+ start:141 stop:1259 length:1119 start_codon:yes stop_codon:yes gene_type:complete
MPPISEEQITEALAGIKLPDSKGNLVDLKMISGIVIRNGNVGFSIEIIPSRVEEMEPVRKTCEEVVRALPGVLSATAVLTAEHQAPKDSKTRHAAAPQNTNTQPAPDLPDVGAIVAVASGKGGVGKSTIAVNLALAFAAKGQRVGIMDADVYGPSMPRMLGITGQPQTAEGKKLRPMENYGVKCMSMGFLVDEDTPMIWRGPMVQGALEQMLRDVLWGKLDFLIVDMPPGTGDAQLTMAQKVPLAGAVIVSTPQDIALLDARKGVAMFQRVDVPVLGFIENMSYFLCPKCGDRSEIFSHGGARDWATKLNVEFLGELPLDIEIRETSDQGKPIVMSNPDSAHSQAFGAIAERISDQISKATGDLLPPKIVTL